MILLSGPYRSGSTWAFNCLQELARVAGKSVHADFSDELTPEIVAAEQAGQCVILKTHCPSNELLGFAVQAKATIFLTTRDPRDCASSLKSQFRFSFYRALADTKRSCDAALWIKRNFSPTVLRYEDHFTSTIETLHLLCRESGLNVREEAQRKIFMALSAKSVRRKIKRFLREGVFDGTVPALQFHAGTHWHPNHVGDGTVRKYRTELSIPERALLMATNLKFLWHFRYNLI